MNIFYEPHNEIIVFGNHYFHDMHVFNILIATK